MYDFSIVLVPSLLSVLVSLWKSNTAETESVDGKRICGRNFYLLLAKRWICFFCINNLLVFVSVWACEVFSKSRILPIDGTNFLPLFLVSLLVSILTGVLFKIIRKELKITVELNAGKKVLSALWQALPFLLAVVSIGISLFQCFDNNFWGDECYTILAVNRSHTFYEVATCDSGCHPPLYFLIFKGLTLLLGQTPWVYHFVSALPQILLILFSLFPLRKKFGTVSSIVFTLFLTMISTVRLLSLETRMYSWAGFFSAMCFYAGYYLIDSKGEKALYWILFCLAGIAAAYTHYFAFAVVILLYFFVFIKLIYHDRKNILKCICAVVVSLICYSPWIGIFLSSVRSVSNSFWITTVETIKTGYCYIYDNKYVLTVYLISFAFAVFTTYKIIRIKHENSVLKVSLFSGTNGNDSVIWMAISIFLSIFIIIIFQRVYATLVRPIFVLKYLFPTAVATWLSFAMLVGRGGINNIKIRNALGTILILVILVTYSNGFISQIKSYYRYNKETTNIYNTVVKNAENEKILLVSDHAHLTWTVLDYYFPDMEYEPFSPDRKYNLNEMNKKTVYLFLSDPVSEDRLKQVRKAFGAKPEFITNQVFAGYQIGLYRITDPSSLSK